MPTTPPGDDEVALKNETLDHQHEINVRVTNENDKVLLAFGELVAWVSMPPLAALELSKHLKDEAEAVLRSDA